MVSGTYSRSVCTKWLNCTSVIRIEWLHARASKARFEEEVRLLKAESSRVGRTFDHLAKEWRKRCIKDGSEANEGSREARGIQAMMSRREATFVRLAVLAREHHAELLRYEVFHL